MPALKSEAPRMPSTVRFIGPIVSVAVLAALAFYTAALFFGTPYPGLDFTPSNQQVRQVFVSAPADQALKAGDELIQVGARTWQDLEGQLLAVPFDGLQPGQTVPVSVKRAGQPLTVQWVYPGPNTAEVAYRIDSEWFLGFLFWLAGTLTALVLRPRDLRWRLLVAFNFVTAIWLTAGAVSRWHTWGSAVVEVVGVWLSLPIYLHLHWIFPRSLARLPPWIWWLLYGGAALLAMGELLGVVPAHTYYLAGLLSFLGLLVLLALHAVFQSSERRNLGLLLVAVGLAVAPGIGVGLAGAAGQLPALAGGAFLALPLAPLAYLYIAYRHRLGGQELRVNRLVSRLIFFVLLATVAIPVIALVHERLKLLGVDLVIDLCVLLLGAAIATIGLAPFERWIEGWLLGLPPAPTGLLETYSARITTRLDIPALVSLIRDELTPGLLIRQSALWHFAGDGQWQPLYSAGLGQADEPRPEQLPALLAENGYRVPGDEPVAAICPWALVVFPLRIDETVIGIWLLGRRDPDDYYAEVEVDILRLLANQLAIALTNIDQADQLHALYQTDTNRAESERTRLAHELHDHVLHELRRLRMSLSEVAVPPEFLSAYELAAASVREVIAGLRPPMLDFGLHAALVSLADMLDQQVAGTAIINLDVPPSAARFSLPVEQHIYRIAQQACENAVNHARAHTVTLRGTLDPDRIDLIVEDDGIGLSYKGPASIIGLVQQKHFGLAGMFERAALIKATVTIGPAPEHGTQVRIVWQAGLP